MIVKHSLEAELTASIMYYIEESKEDMETSELSKVYMSCIKHSLPLDPSFKLLIEEELLNLRLLKSDAHSLPYLLPVFQ
jgi:hypothetical protein